MYFKDFNSIYYDFQIGDEYVIKIMKDITANVRLRKKILESISLFDKYDIQDTDTPDNLAYNIYGSSQLHWALMIANEKYDFQTDWPMTSNTLQKYISEKYNRFEVTSWTYDGREVTATIPGHDIVVTSPEDITLENPWVLIDSVKQPASTMQGVLRLTGASIENETVTFNATGAIIGTPSGGFTLYTSNREYKIIHHYEKNGYVVDPGNGAVPVYCNEYEIAVNDAKRRINILSPEIIAQVAAELQNLIGQ